MTTATRTLTIGHSPDPDDAFMFYGLVEGQVAIDGCRIAHHLEDIQSLNQRALRRELDVTAVSVAVYPRIDHDYWVMHAGASVGTGYGPAVVARGPTAPEQLAGARIAVPGELTTSCLVMRLFQPAFHAVVLPFDRILDAVANGDVSAGLIIHEGQLTYERHGLHRVIDLGAWWHRQTGLPLPLGINVIRRDLGHDLAQRISRALTESIRYAWSHEADALAYALRFGRGLDEHTGQRFIHMYVNDDTTAMSPACQAGLAMLFRQAHAHGLIPRVPEVVFV